MIVARIAAAHTWPPLALADLFVAGLHLVARLIRRSR